MNIKSLSSETMALGIAAIAALLVAACAPITRSSPEQVEANNPTVSYKYRNDDELIQTNQLAETYCSQYRLTPQPSGFAHDRNGNSLVNFECVPALASAMTAVNSNLIHTYRSDQELMDVSQSAHIYCMSNGSTGVTSNIESNANGTKTVTFRCNPS